MTGNPTDHPTNDPIDALVDSLTLDEQVSLLAGADFWHTVPIERAGIPSIRVSDGPAGARGTLFEGGPASVNVPCGTSLAATWDPPLVEEIGRLLGREARAKGARVLLAPTVNLHRTPIGGRNFECMSEDPYLTAQTAVAYVRGLQSEGVAACIKHFIGNDTEFERNSIDSRVDERTLRELYLVPFEAAVKQAGVMSVMTSYNRINGQWAADSVAMIDEVLRGEWGFDGLVMSDWFGLHSTAEGVIAGCDLEMPGPTLHRGKRLVDAVAGGAVSAADVRRSARNVLSAMKRLGAFDDRPGPEFDARPAGGPDARAPGWIRRHGVAAESGCGSTAGRCGGTAVERRRSASCRRDRTQCGAWTDGRRRERPRARDAHLPSARRAVEAARPDRCGGHARGRLPHPQAAAGIVAVAVFAVRDRPVQRSRWHRRSGCAGRRIDEAGVEPDHVDGRSDRARTGRTIPWVLCSVPHDLHARRQWSVAAGDQLGCRRPAVARRCDSR